MRKDPDTEQPERIAFATSEPRNSGDRPCRWTELAVYHLKTPENPARPWRSVIRGCTTYPGETLREEKITVGTLDRALSLFDKGTFLGRSVIAQAEDWRACKDMIPDKAWDRAQIANGDDVVRPATGTWTKDFTPETQMEALRWLYGDELERAKPQTLLARDFGVKESTARMQLNGGRPIMIPLTVALRFFNRPAFEKAREASADA